MKNLFRRRLKAAISVMIILVLITMLAVPQAVSLDESPQNGLWGEYFLGERFDTYVTGRTDNNINFNWSSGTSIQGMPNEHFSVRWTGRIKADFSENYTFTTTADDGVALKINGEKIINDAGPHGAIDTSGSVILEAGKMYSIEIDYYNGLGGGQIHLYWQSDSLVKEIVPTDSLFAPEMKAVVELSYTETGEVATARMLSDSSESVTLVLEKYDMNGNLVKTIEQPRDSFSTYFWKAEDQLESEKNYSYKAYVTDKDGNIISNEAVGKYGVDVNLNIDADKITGDVSPLLYGACMEDVNHELYGGIWSQMIYGENFAEPPKSNLEGFTSAGGVWYTKEADGKNEIWVNRTDEGPKLVIDGSECTTGTVSADVYMQGDGPAGFIIKVTDPKSGADNFNGYEIGVLNNSLRIGKHQYNYNFISDTPCTAPENTWVNLKVEMRDNNMKVYVNDTFIAEYTDPNPLRTGAIGFRAWNSTAGFKNIKFDKNTTGEKDIVVPYANPNVQTSGMWQHELTGTASGNTALIKQGTFNNNAQSQRITFTSGSGTVGINNMGLNRMGMSFVADKDYEGYFYAKSESPIKAYTVMESADDSAKYAEKEIEISGNEWKKYSFTLTPDTTDGFGRFSIELKSAGTLDIGYVFLEPGEWGRYTGLHVRNDVGQRLEEQKLTVLRFGGCMINNGNYKWKEMISEPEFRRNYNGWWYEYSSFGFGIIEFLDLCEALGIVGIPNFNFNETPQDMVDFVNFAMGTDTDNEWVQKRITMGHPEPYDLPYIQIGNEERIDQNFATRFNNIANAIWEINDTSVLVAGDFDYKDIIHDPYNFTGSASGITTLANHKTILDNAAAYDRPVWFDIHFWTDSPQNVLPFFAPAESLYNALKNISPEADFKLAIFELNSHIHTFSRALGNATAITLGENMSDIYGIICSANALQVDGHNDNGWDQGLVFMNSDWAWFQPPAYITQMASDYYRPLKADFELEEKNDDLIISVTRSGDGKSLVVKVVNTSDKPMNLNINIPKFAGYENTMTSVRYSDALNVGNTADNPEASKPSDAESVKNALKDGSVIYGVDGHSYTVIEFNVGEEQTVLPGDLNQDGKVTVTDVVKLREIIMNGNAIANDMQAGDLNNDNKLTVTDIVSVRKIIMGE